LASMIGLAIVGCFRKCLFCFPVALVLVMRLERLDLRASIFPILNVAIPLYNVKRIRLQ
jgi:hypothetical protein